jgi:hypothetical protein
MNNQTVENKSQPSIAVCGCECLLTVPTQVSCADHKCNQCDDVVTVHSLASKTAFAAEKTEIGKNSFVFDMSCHFYICSVSELSYNAFCLFHVALFRETFETHINNCMMGCFGVWILELYNHINASKLYPQFLKKLEASNIMCEIRERVKSGFSNLASADNVHTLFQILRRSGLPLPFNDNWTQYFEWLANECCDGESCISCNKSLQGNFLIVTLKEMYFTCYLSW